MNELDFLKSSHRIASMILSNQQGTLDRVVEEMGVQSGASRSYLFEINGNFMSNTHEYVAPGELKSDENPSGIEAEITNLQMVPLSPYSDFTSILESGNTVNACDINNYGFSNVTRSFLAAQNIKSILVIPLHYEGNLKGFAGFDECKYQRTWEPELVEYLETNADNISMFLRNKQREQKISSLSAMIEQSSDAMILTDADMKINYINPAGEKLYGYCLDEVRGKTPEIFNAEPLAKGIQKDLYDHISKGKDYFFEHGLINRRKDGSTFICQFKVCPLFDEQGKIVGYSGIQRDITQQRQKEHEQEIRLELYQMITHGANPQELRQYLSQVRGGN